MTEAEALANDGFEPVYNVKGMEFEDDGKENSTYFSTTPSPEMRQFSAPRRRRFNDDDTGREVH